MGCCFEGHQKLSMKQAISWVLLSMGRTRGTMEERQTDMFRGMDEACWVPWTGSNGGGPISGQRKDSLPSRLVWCLFRKTWSQLQPTGGCNWDFCEGRCTRRGTRLVTCLQGRFKGTCMSKKGPVGYLVRGCLAHPEFTEGTEGTECTEAQRDPDF